MIILRSSAEPKSRQSAPLPMVEALSAGLPALVENELLIAGIVFAATAIIVALWVPGALLPIAASSGALMNAWTATAVVSLGALAGSMFIFLTARCFGSDRLPAKVTAFVRKFESRFSSRGTWLVFGLRLVGTPHFLVSAASAMTPIPARSFALATLAGMAPAILLASLAGSAV